MDITNSLAHTAWNCKYRQLCEWKNVTIVEAEVCPDHIHMLLEIPPKLSVASFVGFLKGKSSLLIYQKYANMKYKYRNREFWCRGYYVDTVGKNTERIKEYIANQLAEDRIAEQMAITEIIDPFKNWSSLRKWQTRSERFRYAGNMGFYPKMKNHQFYWWFFIIIVKIISDQFLTKYLFDTILVIFR